MQIGKRPDGRIVARQRLRPLVRRKDIAADMEIAGLGKIAVEMDDEMAADGRVHLTIRRPLVGRRAVGQDAFGMDRLVRDAARDAAVDDVDDPADRGGTEEQRCRTAKHLDPVGGQRVDRDRMIDAGIGDIEAPEAVGEDADALAFETAEHRTRGARPEGCGGDAGLVRKRVADRGTEALGQGLAAQHRGAGEDVVAVASEAGDDDFLLLRFMKAAAIALSVMGARRRLIFRAAARVGRHAGRIDRGDRCVVRRLGLSEGRSRHSDRGAGKQKRMKQARLLELRRCE